MKLQSSKFAIDFKKIKNIKAYRSFLLSHKVKLKSLKSVRDMALLPITDKSNYINKFKPEDLLFKGKVPPMISASSGSSGRPNFWFRGDEQEEVGGEIHRIILDKIFNIEKKDSTLVVICFSMGVWIAGSYTLSSFRHVARKGYNLSVISPGIDREDTLNILKNLAPRFKNLILAGYPPFIMDVINDASKKGIKLVNKKVKIITSGDKFSEEWRSDLLSMLNMKDADTPLVSIYGSADAGILGHETPLSIFLRKEASKNGALRRELFGDFAGPIPAVVQYYPSEVNFEAVSNELILTTKTAMPLMRYNIHDTGKILNHAEIKNILEKHGLTKRAIGFGLNDWKLPLLVLSGRTDVAVTFYALNIYPENIKSSIEDPRITKLLTGNYSAFNRTSDKSKTEKLYIKLELADSKINRKKIHRLVTNVLVEKLSEFNIEYRKLRSAIGKKALPVVIFTNPDDNGLNNTNERKLLSLNGKKPRVILVKSGL
ncbi:MAG: hypothetical protein AAB787_03325 [Patescibacteria group bacterium]